MLIAHPIQYITGTGFRWWLSSLVFLFSTTVAFTQYNGSGSVTRGLAAPISDNLFDCANGRIARLGTITGDDNTAWTVPSEVHFANPGFPWASDLHNACVGANYPDATAALAALDGSDIVIIDNDGDLITGFVFADNYFEMYINGIAVGKDRVPFTQFNSSLVRFRVKRPFTIAMLLVDWEENLGVGSENNMGFTFHPGDGGMVAVFKDTNNEIIAITGSDWKAQTFYTSPVRDLSCPSENGALRLSDQCSTANSNDGSGDYALHWARPVNWMNEELDDTDWPDATVFSNEVIGVNNKPAYTNFTDIFDDPVHDALFIWSTNVILDNEVIVRYTVGPATSVHGLYSNDPFYQLFPNPFISRIKAIPATGNEYYVLFNALGEVVYEGKNLESGDFSGLPPGIYYLQIDGPAKSMYKVIKE